MPHTDERSRSSGYHIAYKANYPGFESRSPHLLILMILDRSLMLTGYPLYHNYFREHEGLNGKTPAEIAGIKIEGPSKWMTVIQQAAMQN